MSDRTNPDSKRLEVAEQERAPDSSIRRAAVTGDEIADESTHVSGEPIRLSRTIPDSRQDQAEAPETEEPGAGEAGRRPARSRTVEKKSGRVEAEPVPASVRALSDTMAAAESTDSAISYVPSAPSNHDDGPDPLIGLVVAERYRIVERIGRGGMGIVYRVQHTRIGKLLAMKLLAGELSANSEVIRRFKQEALTVSKLSCPNTVQVFDYGVWQHLTYLVMELVEGQDLSRALRRHGPLPFARLGRLMVQVCSSLAEAHSKGIVHRDIKPENIMLIADARGGELAKVLDFGLAKIREGRDLNEVTMQGAVVGTPYYMSPEQVLGEEVDGRTDIYSLGAVMYRALTGHYPFNAGTPMGMFTKHLTEPAPAIDEKFPDLGVPPGVSDMVLRCMEKAPEDRYGNVEQLREVLLTEIGALGLPSQERILLGEDLLDSGAIPRPGHPRAQEGPDPAQIQIATRQELEAYEAKLRRARYGAWALLALALGGGAAAGAYLYRVRAEPAFSNVEREPNNKGADANPLPLGAAVQGSIGRRMDSKLGDRDFYLFSLPGEAEQHLRIELTGLPNFPLCMMLVRRGYEQALAQYCQGGVGRDLVVPALRLGAGEYFVAVLQDRDPHDGSGELPILENVSDNYAIKVSRVEPSATDEIEPNDTLATGQRLAPGAEVRGTLGWVGDEDTYCAAAGAGVVRWEVADGRRERGTVLEATMHFDGSQGAIMRVHPPGAKPYARPRLEADVNSPWTSTRQTAGERCLRLRLAQDPWQDVRGPVPERTEYTVKLVAGKGGAR